MHLLNPINDVRQFLQKCAKLTRSIRNTRFVVSRTALRGEVSRGKITRAIAGMPSGEHSTNPGPFIFRFFLQNEIQVLFRFEKQLLALVRHRTTQPS